MKLIMTSNEPRPSHGLKPEALETIRFITQQQQQAFELANTFWAIKSDSGELMAPLEAPEVLARLNEAPSMLDKFGVFFEHIDIMNSYTLAHIDHAEDEAALRTSKGNFSDLLCWFETADLTDSELPREGNRTLHIRSVDGALICNRQRTLVRLTADHIPEFAPHNICTLEIKKRMLFAIDTTAIDGLDAYLAPYFGTDLKQASAVVEMPDAFALAIEAFLDASDRSVIAPISTTYYAAVNRAENGTNGTKVA